MSILITGTCGFIGSHLTEKLLSEGNKIIGIDNFDDYYLENLKKQNLKILKKYDNFEFVQDSILNKDTINKITKNVDIIYHLAAIAGVRNSIQNPTKYVESNILGTNILLDAACKNNINKFVFASSSSVYGDVAEKDLPVQENHVLDPISPYALSKMHCEHWCEMYSKLYGLNTTSLRYFTVYGPRQRPDEAFTKFITKTLNNETIEIYGDGTQTRDFTYVSDIVDGTILASQNGAGAYNLGGGSRKPLNDILDTLNELLDNKINKIQISEQQGDVKNTSADISKAKKELGYEPKIDIKTGLQKHVDWCKSNKTKSKGII
ncbi:MAG: GDP-mannose 4,6-dehydratase [DPANN group archaeon]|nr:GDP-mannose 4,6-dehydratase [DPANN group archaeon]